MFHIYSESHSNYTVQEIIIIIILKSIHYLVIITNQSELIAIILLD